jgi:hypothetical protein
MWIPTFNIEYAMGLDGISMPLLLLTTFVFFLSMWASWPIDKHVKAYCILFLILEAGVIGVFLSLDFFLFYVFWEVMLLPMYFLIGVWGGPRREYAAIKFFIYTLLGGVFMLIAVLMLYFASDLWDLSRPNCKRLKCWTPSRGCADRGDNEKVMSKAIYSHLQHPGFATNRTPRATGCKRPTTTFESYLIQKRRSVVGVPLLFIGFVIKVRACRCIPGCRTPTSRPRRRSR